MAWHHVAADWRRVRKSLVRRFPNLDPLAVIDAPSSKTRLAQMVADAHDLTVFEAGEALQDFLDLEALAREALDLRHD